MAIVTGSPATTPDSIAQRPRVPHTESPSSPSELRYRPVTPSLSSLGTVVACPLASVKTSGVVEGCSSARATRIPISPSLLSVKPTGAPTAVSVVTRSMARRPSAARKTNRVSSRSSGFPWKSTHSAVTSSTPSPAPLSARRTARCRIVPIAGARAGGIASELFQKSSPFTSP